MDVEDDAAYKKSVRNMAIVLATIVITVFAFIFIPPLLNPAHDNFQKSVSAGTGQSFTLYLTINSTEIPAGGGLNLTAWEVSTAPAIYNVSASDSWSVAVSHLWTRPCTLGWPIGVGIMEGHYDQSNYSLGTLIPITNQGFRCPAMTNPPPSWFAFEPASSDVIAGAGGSLTHWTITTSYAFNHNSSSIFTGVGGLTPGVYTAIAADEWGDVLTTNFLVSG